MRCLAVVLLVSLAWGCGGDASSGTPEDAARSYVEAVNDADWKRACALTVSHEGFDCERQTARVYDNERPLQTGTFSRDGETTFFELVPADDSGGRDGWTSYPPPVMGLERVDGSYRVHWEIAVIR